jgi:hypothetical protein
MVLPGAVAAEVAAAARSGAGRTGLAPARAKGEAGAAASPDGKQKAPRGVVGRDAAAALAPPPPPGAPRPIDVAAEAREAERTEHPRPPAQEAHPIVPGRKESPLPAPAQLLPAPAHPPRAAASPAPSPAATLPRASPARPAAEGGDVEGAVLRNAAHLRIDSGQPGVGEIELHLRVREGVAHLRVDGEGGHLVAARAPELAAALAGAGLSLGKLETPPSAAPDGRTGSESGFGGSAGSGAAPDGQPGSRHPGGHPGLGDPDARPDPRERGPPAAPIPPRPSQGHLAPAASRSRIHVEA